MATEAENPLETFHNAVESNTTQLRSAFESLRSEWPSMAASITGHPLQLPITPEEIAEPASRLSEAALSTGQTTITESFEALSGTLERTSEAQSQRHTEMQSVEEQVFAAMQGATDEVQAAKVSHPELSQAAKDDSASFDQFVGDLQAKTDDAHERLSAAITSVSEQLKTAHQPAISERVQEFMATLRQMLEQSITQSIADAQQNLQNHGVTFGEKAQQLGDDFRQQMTDRTEEILKFVESEVGVQIQEVGERLTEEALSELAEEIAEAVAETAIGVAVTGAISPVLPGLIALHRITDAIRDAIAVFKAVKDIF